MEVLLAAASYFQQMDTHRENYFSLLPPPPLPKTTALPIDVQFKKSIKNKAYYSFWGFFTFYLFAYLYRIIFIFHCSLRFLQTFMSTSRFWHLVLKFVWGGNTNYIYTLVLFFFGKAKVLFQYVFLYIMYSASLKLRP